MRKYLPQVDFLINRAQREGFEEHPALLKKAIKRLLERQKELIIKGVFKEEEDIFSGDNFKKELSREIAEMAMPPYKRIINATGTIIHTNLGRAPLSKEIIQEIEPYVCHYSSLEFDIKGAKRGSRQDNIRASLWPEKGMVIVNNNAAACLLVLSALAKGKEVIVSRGELVEIGGSFRIPEVMELSGCLLREVGTTNKTRLSDYEKAINDNTGMILKVHRSNFRLEGFVEEVGHKELMALSKRFNIPFYFDMGSGALEIIKRFDSKEPIITEVIKEGADIISFSSDKLLGGCQGGVIVGNKDLVGRLKRHPLYRAIRPDKLTIYYLERLFYYISIEDYQKIPVFKMMLEDLEDIRKRANRAFRLIKKEIKNDFCIEVSRDEATFGGGSMPLKTLPTYVIRFKLPWDENKIKRYFLDNDPPILIRQQNGYSILDFRTIFEEEINNIVRTVINLFLKS